MNVSYVSRSFLDYRIPVFQQLCKKLNGNLHVVYSEDYIPDRVNHKIKQLLKNNAVGLKGEKGFGKSSNTGFANSMLRFVFQPGLLGEIRKTKPDVIIGYGFFQWTLFLLIYKLFYRIPLVVCYERTFHTERNAQWFRTAYRRFVVKHINAMCCNGKFSVEYTRALGMPNDKITTGHMVADTYQLEKKIASLTGESKQHLRNHLNTKGIVFLTIGRMIKPKGIRELLSGWSLFNKQFPDEGTLLVVGSGPEEYNLKAHVRENKIKGIRFIGQIDYDDIADYYHAADVFIIPTLEDNWSLVVPEAMVSGLPVLCSIYNGCYPELIKQGKNGWVFDPYKPQEIHDVLKKCVDKKNQLKLKAMGNQSKKIVSSYNPETAADSIIEACRLACNEPMVQ